MRILFILVYFFANVTLYAQDPVPATGQWREHLPWNSAIAVAAGEERIWCATPYALFAVTDNQSLVYRFSKMNGLSETGISNIAVNESGTQLCVAYTNSNLDLIEDGDITNIPDLKRENSPGDKSIYAIYPKAGFYYLSTGIGVIVVNAARAEISDSWFIGNNGDPVKVNAVTINTQYIYAATAEGLKRTPVNGTAPADFRNWETTGGTVAVQDVFSLGQQIICRRNDSLFAVNNNGFSFFYTDGWPVISSRVSEGKLLLCERQLSGTARIRILDASGNLVRELSQTGAVSFPREALLRNNEPWVADQYACLSHVGANTDAYVNFSPSSPQGITGGDLVWSSDKILATSGAVNSDWNYQYNGDGIYILENNQWQNINRYRYPVLDSLLDFMAVASDKRDGSTWAGSYGGGLVQVKNGAVFNIYKQGFLDATIGDPQSYRVAGLAFDKENNLWVSNFGAAQPLKVIKPDGSWVTTGMPFSLFQQAVSQIVIDDYNYKWIVSPLGNGLLTYDHGTSIDLSGDDRWRKWTAGAALGNLPSSDVYALAKDRNGFIWVGTANGVAVIQCADQPFSSACAASWPVVPNGNFAGYLFNGQTVYSIAVDGADRKWMATSSGVYLVNPSGEKVITHFSETNSPLLSNEVRRITIDGKTGEVFFATAKGLCSFRGDATEGGTSNEKVLVFPNPVPPGYNGSIAIRGLVQDAIVKITELDGKLVWQSRALGGQAVWNGRNYKGQAISSGVYLVLLAREDCKEEVVTKIFFIQR